MRRTNITKIFSADGVISNDDDVHTTIVSDVPFEIEEVHKIRVDVVSNTRSITFDTFIDSISRNDKIKCYAVLVDFLGDRCRGFYVSGSFQVYVIYLHFPGSCVSGKVFAIDCHIPTCCRLYGANGDGIEQEVQIVSSSLLVPIVDTFQYLHDIVPLKWRATDFFRIDQLDGVRGGLLMCPDCHNAALLCVCESESNINDFVTYRSLLATECRNREDYIGRSLGIGSSRDEMVFDICDEWAAGRCFFGSVRRAPIYCGMTFSDEYDEIDFCLESNYDLFQHVSRLDLMHLDRFGPRVSCLTFCLGELSEQCLETCSGHYDVCSDNLSNTADCSFDVGSVMLSGQIHWYIDDINVIGVRSTGQFGLDFFSFVYGHYSNEPSFHQFLNSDELSFLANNPYFSFYLRRHFLDTDDTDPEDYFSEEYYPDW
jgi:hypothetical protein